MKKQRETKNLGINRSRKKEEMYKFIDKKFGPLKKCHRVSSKNKFGLGHEGPNPLEIRKFALRLDVCILSEKGNIVGCKTVPLQSACITCDRLYRAARIKTSRDLFKDMSNSDVRKLYTEKYGLTFKCSVCDKVMIPEMFAISKSMETGLHNQCLSCSKSYSEAVGNRWIIYSPQGRNSCRVSKDNELVSPSKDHVWPLSKGGSDNIENILYIERYLNSVKSNSIPNNIKSPEDLIRPMISDRYWPILQKAISEKWSIEKLDLSLAKAVGDLILRKSKMSDKQLGQFFEKEKVSNNTKHNIERAVKKFREYCKNSKSLNL